MEELATTRPIIRDIFKSFCAKLCYVCCKDETDDMIYSILYTATLKRSEVLVFPVKRHKHCASPKYLLKYCALERDVTYDYHGVARNLLTGLQCRHCKVVEYRKAKHGKCAGCKTVLYCSEACQQQDWAEHKKECARLAASTETPNTVDTCIGKECEEQPLKKFTSRFLTENVGLDVYACSLRCLRHAYKRAPTLFAEGLLAPLDPKTHP